MASPSKSRILWPLATLAIGLGTGWLAGRQDGASNTSANSQSSNQASASKTGPASRDPSSPNGDRHSHTSRAESKALADSIRAAFRENVEERRMQMFENMLEKMRPDQLPMVVSLIRENDLRGTGSAGEWSRLWASWGKRDPQAAMEFIRSFDWEGWNPAAQEEARNKTFTYWAQTDPESACKFVEQGRELPGWDRAGVWGLVRGWSTVDPEAAAQWLFKSGLGMSGEYKTVVEAISRKGGQEGLDAWFTSIKEAGAPDKDLQGFADIIAQNKRAYQPAKAAAWLEQHLQEPWLEGSEIVDNTARALAQKDPREAMEWASRSGLEEASITAMLTWCQQDFQAASQWLSENAKAPGYAQNASLMAQYLRHNDPAAARKWAESISDPGIKESTLRILDSN